MYYTWQIMVAAIVVVIIILLLFYVLRTSVFPMKFILKTTRVLYFKNLFHFSYPSIL